MLLCLMFMVVLMRAAAAHYTSSCAHHHQRCLTPSQEASTCTLGPAATLDCENAKQGTCQAKSSPVQHTTWLAPHTSHAGAGALTATSVCMSCHCPVPSCPRVPAPQAYTDMLLSHHACLHTTMHSTGQKVLTGRHFKGRQRQQRKQYTICTAYQTTC